MKLHTQCILKVASLVLVVALCAVPMINLTEAFAAETNTMATVGQKQPPLVTDPEYQKYLQAARKQLQDLNSSSSDMDVNDIIYKLMVSIDIQMPGFSQLEMVAEAKEKAENNQYNTADSLNEWRAAIVAVPGSQYTMDDLESMDFTGLLAASRTLPKYQWYGFTMDGEQNTQVVQLGQVYYDARRGSDLTLEVAAKLFATAQVINPDFHVEFRMTSAEQTLYNNAVNEFLEQGGGQWSMSNEKTAVRKDIIKKVLQAVNSQVPEFTEYNKIDFAANYQIAGYTIATTIEDAPENYSNSPKSVLIEQILQSQGLVDADGELWRLTIPELIAQSKSLAAYQNNIEVTIGYLISEQTLGFKDLVDQLEQAYDHGCNTLRELLPQVGVKIVGLDQMTGEQMAIIARSLPTGFKYGFGLGFIPAKQEVSYINFNNIAINYSNLNHDLKYGILFGGMSNEAIEHALQNAAESYGHLIVAATRVNPDFNIGTAVQVLPSLPEAGTVTNEERSAMVIKIALGSVTGIIIVCGLVLITKRFLFSPLKRRK